VLLQTPLFAALQRAIPTAERIAVVHPSMAHLLEDQPHIDEVVPFSLRGWPFTPSSWRAVGRLTRLRCDVTIDCSNYTELSTSHAAATLMTRAPRRVGFTRGVNAALCYNLPVAPLVGIESERRQRLHLLTALDIDAPDTATHYRPRGTPRSEVVALIEQSRRSPRGSALLNPGGRLGWRRVSPEVLATAALRLIEHGREVIVAWGPGERELAEEIARLSGARASVAPATDLDELGALAQAIGCTVTNNSGPMHLSVAVGAPTLAVFVDMPSGRWGYPDHPHAIVDLSGLQEPEPVLRHAVDRFLDNLG